jgi:uncharacterized protein YidB (DUF937 family)
LCLREEACRHGVQKKGDFKHMSLLDIAEQALGGANSAGGGSAAISEVMNLVNSYPGGVGGLVSCFEKNGLGGVASSWVGTGANQPVSAQQVQSGLGNDAISSIASKLGVSPDVASGVVAQLLPHVVDHLTPGGQIPAGGGDMLSMGESILKSLLNK